MLREYSLYFKSNNPSIMKGYNMKMVEGLHMEHCVDNLYAVFDLDTMEKMQKALKLIRENFGYVRIDITKDVQGFGTIIAGLVKTIEGIEEVDEQFYHGECANCKSRIYGECEGAENSNTAEFYSCYTEFEEESIDYEEHDFDYYCQDSEEKEEDEEDDLYRWKQMRACDRDWNTGSEMYDDLCYDEY